VEVIKVLGIRARFSIGRLIVCFVLLALFLALIKGAYRRRTYGADVGLDVVARADRSETVMEAHAGRMVSRAILGAALGDPRLSARERFRRADDPEAELRRMVHAWVADVGAGTLRVMAEGGSDEEATATASAVADAYARDQGPGRVVVPIGQRIGHWRTGAPLDLPWHVALATAAAILASASILIIPSCWLGPVPVMRAIAARFRRSPRRCLLRALLGLAVIPPALLGLSLLGLFPWSGLNCWQDDIDIASGRIRHTRYLLWAPVGRSVEETPLTRALAPEDLHGKRADWRPVVTLSPGYRHSPHYRFHSAISQVRTLELLWDAGRATPEARRSDARRVLRMWQQSGGYHEVEGYLLEISERVR
jgi:hypothetical protein